MAWSKVINCDGCGKVLGSSPMSNKSAPMHGGFSIPILEINPMFEKADRKLNPKSHGVSIDNYEDGNGIDVCNLECLKVCLTRKFESLGFQVPTPTAQSASMNMVEHLLRKDLELHIAFSKATDDALLKAVRSDCSQLVRDCEASIHTLPDSYKLVPNLIKRYWESCKI